MWVRLAMSVGFTLLLLELGAAGLISMGQVPARYPTFTVPKPREPFFIDIDPRFGAWHPPDRSLVHRRACFDVEYHSNSYGALDIERERQATTHRTIVLGDSFATGHGVRAQDRFSNRLEALTSIPHLNFGAGGTGPTQYLKVYEHLAREFSHDRVLVSVLPANDFFDDEPTRIRYRPYWDGEYPNYSLRYSLPSPADSQHHPSHFRERVTLHDALGSYSFLYNALDWVAGALKVVGRRGQGRDYAGYFDFNEGQLNRLRYSLERLTELAPAGKLAVVTIPRYVDLTRYSRTGDNPLGTALSRFAAETGFEFIDLLPPMHRAYAGREADLFLDCDGHWSPLGHDVAARILSDRLYR